jgi:hypothetical protein
MEMGVFPIMIGNVHDNPNTENFHGNQKQFLLIFGHPSIDAIYPNHNYNLVPKQRKEI